VPEVLHCLALVSGLGACAALALAMEVHWLQVRGAGAVLPRPTARLLRSGAALALAASLALCLHADHASMAVLVWVMSLSAGAAAVAFTLAWRPHCLSGLATLVLVASRQPRP
jgi:hypothetical protein